MAPVLVKASVPPVFLILPVEVPPTMAPKVNVEVVEAAVLSTEPVPLNPLSVSELPLRSRVPLILRVPAPTPSGSTLEVPSLSVAAAVTVTGAVPAILLLVVLCSV